MRIIIALVVTAGILGMAGVSDAAQISSPAIFGAFTQTVAECVVLNAGESALSVTVKIVNESGGVIKSYSCGGALGPDDFCSVATTISWGVAHGCVATAGSTATLRGALTIDETVSDGFGYFYLRAIRSAPLR